MNVKIEKIEAAETAIEKFKAEEQDLRNKALLDGIIDDGTRGSTKREVIGQGIGNLAAGMTGGIGGCALIGQSLINAQSGGGVSRLSGMSMALFLALGIVVRVAIDPSICYAICP